ncbi:MAG TPA: ABC-2 family transporter protein [Gemmataceae bacterium]|jgi:ABC-2 type transport system permease protein|nr:ABC-2 family transporter protein [Gemmataceae bacterium]
MEVDLYVIMNSVFRYVRLWFAFARFALLGELAFRGNFIMKMLVEILWLIILLMFYRTIFANTRLVAGWTEHEYLFFVGCYFALEGLIETLFLENCQDFSNQVRTGNLDSSLLLPLDEQFLVTCRKIDWSTLPNFLMGVGVMVRSLAQNPDWHFRLLPLMIFMLVFACALLLAYSFLLILTSSAVWMIRNQSLMELWWLFSSLMRYPREVFTGASWAVPISLVFTFLLPVMLVTNVPANVMVRTFEPENVLFIIAATAAMLVVSRWFFRRALRRYRSASS